MGALVARIACPVSRRIEAAAVETLTVETATFAAPPLSAGSPEPAARVDAVSQVTCFVNDCEGRLLSNESSAWDGECGVDTYFG